MSDEDLRIQGTLDETTVPDLFRSLIRSGETGIVSLESAAGQSSIYFREGRIVFATSSDPDLGLAEVLLRAGELTLDQYTKAGDELFGFRKIAAVLYDLGFLQPEELTRALERQVSTIVTHSLGLRTGSYVVDFTEEFPADTVSLSLNTERLVLDAIGHFTHWSLLSRCLGRMSRLLRHAANADARIFHLDLTEEESHVYALLAEAASPESLCQRSYLSNFDTLRSTCALLAVNLIEDAEEKDASDQREAVQTELELEALVEKYNSSFQAIFSIVFQEIGDYTFDFADRVLTHLSPEVLPYMAGITMVNEARVDFDQLFDNLVTAGAADRRGVVTEVLNELLYGWIYEMRTEFGTRFEAETGKILAKMR